MRALQLCVGVLFIGVIAGMAIVGQDDEALDMELKYVRAELDAMQKQLFKLKLVARDRSGGELPTPEQMLAVMRTRRSLQQLLERAQHLVVPEEFHRLERDRTGTIESTETWLESIKVFRQQLLEVGIKPHDMMLSDPEEVEDIFPEVGELDKEESRKAVLGHFTFLTVLGIASLLLVRKVKEG